MFVCRRCYPVALLSSSKSILSFLICYEEMMFKRSVENTQLYCVSTDSLWNLLYLTVGLRRRFHLQSLSKTMKIINAKQSRIKCFPGNEKSETVLKQYHIDSDCESDRFQVCHTRFVNSVPMNLAFRVNFINDKAKQLEQFVVHIFESVVKENKLLVTRRLKRHYLSFT